jgi:molybdopterin converting factor small subunit
VSDSAPVIAQVELVLPPAVRPAAGGRTSVTLAAGDVAGLLAALRAAHPEAWRMVCDERGEPRPHIHVFVNLDRIQSLRGLATLLREGDVVTIVPAVSGG